MVRMSDEPIRVVSEEYRGNHYREKPISVSILTGGGADGCQPISLLSKALDGGSLVPVVLPSMLGQAWPVLKPNGSRLRNFLCFRSFLP